ncbi:unnamed protein product [Leptosia nina]|uniref:Secreted protein n=1 Tax=Leptosia nina TaxID=320188 RepID=A0AAV1J201_9NEOP
MYKSVRTISAMSLTVRWLAIVLLGAEWQVHSQLIQPTSEVESSYNFYYEQPCCTSPLTKSKYHTRHRRAVIIGGTMYPSYSMYHIPNKTYYSVSLRKPLTCLSFNCIGRNDTQRKVTLLILDIGNKTFCSKFGHVYKK